MAHDVRIHDLRQGMLGSAASRIGRGNGWALVAQLASALDRGAVVHGHTLLTALPGFTLLDAFTRLVSWKHARWIETIHDGRLPERFRGWPASDRRRYVRSLQQADRVIAVSPPLADFLVDSGLAQSRVVTISPLLPSPAAYDRAIDPISPFVASHDPVVLGIGAMVPHYDFRTLVEAFADLRTAHADAGLVLLTSTFDRDDAYATALKRDLERLGEDARVLVDVSGPVVRTLMEDADVVVRGPARESYGLSRVESLLAGTPVVGTAGRGAAFRHHIRVWGSRLPPSVPSAWPWRDRPRSWRRRAHISRLPPARIFERLLALYAGVPAVTSLLRRPFVRQASSIYALQAVGMGAGLLTSIAIARVLGPAGKGSVDLFVLLTTLIAEFGLLGITYGFTYSLANRGRPLAQVHGNAVVAAVALGVVGLGLAVVLLALREVLGGAIDVAQVVFVLAIAEFSAYSAGWTGMMFGIDQAPLTYVIQAVASVATLALVGLLLISGLLGVEAAIGVIASRSRWGRSPPVLGRAAPAPRGAARTRPRQFRREPGLRVAAVSWEDRELAPLSHRYADRQPGRRFGGRRVSTRWCSLGRRSSGLSAWASRAPPIHRVASSTKQAGYAFHKARLPGSSCP